MQENGPEKHGLFASLRQLATTALSTLQVRLELFSVELQEEKTSLIEIFLWTAAVIFSCLLAIVMVTVTVVWLSPETARPYILVGFCSIYLFLALFTIVKLSRSLKIRPPPFSGTISELKKDIAAMDSRK